MIDVDVQGEIGTLRAVVTSAPGAEMDRMVPANLEKHRAARDGRLEDNPDYLLYDDLVHLPTIQREHRELVRIIEAVTGPGGHFGFRALLTATLGDPDVRSVLIDDVLAAEGELYGRSDAELARSEELMAAMDPGHLVEVLITGYERFSGRSVLRWPIPNVMFARDLGSTVGDAVVVAYAAKPARRRDMQLSRAVFLHHPWFAGVDVVDVGDDGPVRPKDGENATLEGGDVMVVDERVVLVGLGERSTMEAARRLAARLLPRGVEAVLAVRLPVARGFMHIDTLMSRIDEDHCLVFPPMIQAPERLGFAVRAFTAAGERDMGANVFDALRDVGVELTPVACGGDDPVVQQREQWTDGANAVALAPGVIVTYDRNDATLRELNLVGYEAVTADEFVANAPLFIAEGRRVAIMLPGSELVRGRGGPRCLTLPLRRG